MKIRCNSCVNLESRKCNIIGRNVSPNKSRICEHYNYDETKVKIKQNLPVTQASLESIGKSKTRNKQRVRSNKASTAIKHPLTGDLSRFITTSKKGD